MGEDCILRFRRRNPWPSWFRCYEPTFASTASCSPTSRCLTSPGFEEEPNPESGGAVRVPKAQLAPARPCDGRSTRKGVSPAASPSVRVCSCPPDCKTSVQTASWLAKAVHARGPAKSGTCQARVLSDACRASPCLCLACNE